MFFILFVQESKAISVDRRRRCEMARTPREIYECTAMIRTRVCGEEEGESRRNREQEEGMRTKLVDRLFAFERRWRYVCLDLNKVRS